MPVAIISLKNYLECITSYFLVVEITKIMNKILKASISDQIKMENLNFLSQEQCKE